MQKEAPTSGTASGTYVPPTTVLPSPDTIAMPDTTFMPDTTVVWYTPTVAAHCSSIDLNAARAVAIKSNLYDPNAGMISPDSAKIIAQCAVPGQIGGGDMHVADGRTEYSVEISPNHKRTHTKVIVDAKTGAVLSSKQAGGLRALAGWVRESEDHESGKKAAAKAPRDTMPE